MTFKGLLNERMPSNFQLSIKEKKRELRTATETEKPIQETEKYCAVVAKLKRYLFDKTSKH